MYIDDSLFAAQISEFPAFAALLLVFFRLVGVPISWKKLEGGLFVDWVGFRLNFSSRRAYLSEARLAKIETSMSEMSQLLRVPFKQFRKVTFQMMWVSQSFPMSKVLLEQFFSRLNNKDLIQGGFIFDIQKLVPIFDLWTQMIKAARVWKAASVPYSVKSYHLTRTDAAAESAGLFLGGWFSESPIAFRAGQIQWFAYQLDPSFFPVSKKANNHLISASEALAVAIAIALWGSKSLQSDSLVTVLGSKKWFSGSTNLALSLTCVVQASFHWQIRPIVSWTSGESNRLADSLSRMSIDPKAAARLAWLPSGGRADSEVLFAVLPALRPYLIPLEVAR